LAQGFAIKRLRNAPEWTDVLAYDEFEVRVVTRRPPPWGGTKVAKWADDHDTRACAWFQDVGIPANVGVVGRSIQMRRENPVHPVRENLNALHWDRTPRLDSWLTRYLGVEDNPYVRAVGSRFLLSAVARVFKPGCQADNVLILEGPQGILKSSALRALAEPWFADRISQLGSKDSAIEVAGVWLFEMSELQPWARAREIIEEFRNALRCCSRTSNSCQRRSWVWLGDIDQRDQLGSGSNSIGVEPQVAWLELSAIFAHVRLRLFAI
jgi:predicted P-loop ATPase